MPQNGMGNQYFISHLFSFKCYNMPIDNMLNIFANGHTLCMSVSVIFPSSTKGGINNCTANPKERHVYRFQVKVSLDRETQ